MRHGEPLVVEKGFTVDDEVGEQTASGLVLALGVVGGRR
jgi:hypothetical protein